MCYKVISENELARMNVEEIDALRSSISKKTLKELCFYDLCQPGKSCIGLYFIESPDKQKLYIGKSTSRSVCERIGGHLDSRSFAFCNSLPRKVAKAVSSGKPTDQELFDALVEIGDWNISVLFVECETLDLAKRLISKAESLLISSCNGCINKSRRQSTPVPTGPLSSLI